MNPNDIAFLMQRTSLSFEKLLSLFEEDYDLLVDSIGQEDINNAPISLPLFTRLSIFKKTKNTGFSLSDKAYVADCVAVHYPKMHNQSHYLIDQRVVGEAQGQYYLVLAGLFPEFLKAKSTRTGAPSIDFYISVAQKAFYTADRFSLADSLHDWVHLLNQLKHTKWN